MRRDLLPLIADAVQNHDTDRLGILIREVTDTPLPDDLDADERADFLQNLKGLARVTDLDDLLSENPDL